MYYDSQSKAKKQIFEKSIELFSAHTFDVVTINEIAQAIGKTKSSLYNHFSSKQQILDEIYDFFCMHFNDNRKTLDEIMPILESGSLMDIIHSVFFEFGQSGQLILLILRIVHQRKYYDEKACLMAQTILFEDGVRFCKTVFDMAVEIGRLAPFDTQALAVMCNNSRLCHYDKWVMDPTEENIRVITEEEDTIFSYITLLLTDLKQPVI